jgi:TonB family protein
MGLFLVYILKASLCLAVFYLFYRALLGKETFHRFNRLALLNLLVLSCLLPAIEVTVSEAPKIGQVFVSLEEMMLPVPEDEVILDESSAALSWKEAMLLVYVLGILFFLARHLWSFARMVVLLRTSHKERLDGGITLFVHRQQIAPFSWMKLIAVSEADLAENREAILAHERAHIANRHSWDLLLAEVCAFFQWFNPAAWLLKQELQTVHEYEADEWVIRHGIDAKTYQLLLIKKAVGAKLYYMANSLNQSSLKKRITMMMKKKSNPWARMKYAFVLPLAAVTVAAFARPEVSNRLDEISSVNTGLLMQTMQDKTVKVTGQVLEADTKQPIPGVTVIVRGTVNGMMTDVDGKFSFPKLAEGDVLQFSYVGLQTQTVVVKDEKPLTVLMKENIQPMEELVVLGYADDDSDAEQKVVENPKEASQEEVIFTIVEEMPQYPGGIQAAMAFFAQNIKYPVSAQKAQIEGSVTVQFVVGTDGSVRNPKVVRGVNPELDAEALRVVGIMPKWTPGKQRGKAVPVSYNLPVRFRLAKKATSGDADVVKVDMKFPQGVNKKVGVGPNGGVGYETIYSMTFRTEKGADPLIVVDGKELGRGINLLETMSPNDIEKIEVLKDATAKEKYGDKAKDGVIMVTTKKKAK